MEGAITAVTPAAGFICITVCFLYTGMYTLLHYLTYLCFWTECPQRDGVGVATTTYFSSFYFQCIQPTSLWAWILMNSTSWSATWCQENLCCFSSPKHPVWNNKRGCDSWGGGVGLQKAATNRSSTTVQHCARNARTANHTLCLIWGEFMCVVVVLRFHPILQPIMKFPAEAQ